jgi:hypothetical protein
MKKFILQDECFLHFIVDSEIVHRVWDFISLYITADWLKEKALKHIMYLIPRT